MIYRTFAILSALVAFAGLATGAAPPMPGMTNGGASANNGMKHVLVGLSGSSVTLHVDEPPATPVTMMSGFGVDYTDPRFDVLEGRFFNAQHGWLPERFDLLASLPSGASFWIERLGATEPVGGVLKVYEAGMGSQMATWTMNPIYAANGDRWQWDGVMQHDFYTANRPGDYAMQFRVYVGDGQGNALTAYAPAEVLLRFTAVPEPATAALLALGVAALVVGRSIARR